jgi:hypothetical protein
VPFEIVQRNDYIDTPSGMIDTVEKFSEQFDNATVLLRGAWQRHAGGQV